VAAFIIPMLVALPMFLFWLVVVALLVRPFGVQLPLGPFSFGKRTCALQAFTFFQYVLVCGVLCFGCGMLIAMTVSHYVEWKYWPGSSLTTYNWLRDAMEYLLSGVLFGLVSYFTRSGNSS
jgi:hypothetical protein